jgi:hypothetical protein
MPGPASEWVIGARSFSLRVLGAITVNCCEEARSDLSLSPLREVIGRWSVRAWLTSAGWTYRVASVSVRCRVPAPFKSSLVSTGIGGCLGDRTRSEGVRYGCTADVHN